VIHVKKSVEVGGKVGGEVAQFLLSITVLLITHYYIMAIFSNQRSFFNLHRFISLKSTVLLNNTALSILRHIYHVLIV